MRLHKCKQSQAIIDFFFSLISVSSCDKPKKRGYEKVAIENKWQKLTILKAINNHLNEYFIDNFSNRSEHCFYHWNEALLSWLRCKKYIVNDNGAIKSVSSNTQWNLNWTKKKVEREKCTKKTEYEASKDSSEVECRLHVYLILWFWPVGAWNLNSPLAKHSDMRLLAYIINGFSAHLSRTRIYATANSIVLVVILSSSQLHWFRCTECECLYRALYRFPLILSY